VVGRAAGASGGQVAIEANANQILDEADTATPAPGRPVG